MCAFLIKCDTATAKSCDGKDELAKFVCAVYKHPDFGISVPFIFYSESWDKDPKGFANNLYEQIDKANQTTKKIFLGTNNTEKLIKALESVAYNFNLESKYYDDLTIYIVTNNVINGSISSQYSNVGITLLLTTDIYAQIDDLVGKGYNDIRK